MRQKQVQRFEEEEEEKDDNNEEGEKEESDLLGGQHYASEAGATLRGAMLPGAPPAPLSPENHVRCS